MSLGVADCVSVSRFGLFLGMFSIASCAFSLGVRAWGVGVCWGVLGGGGGGGGGGQVETEKGVEHHNWLAIPVGVLALLGGQ